MPEKDKDALDREYAVREVNNPYFAYPNHPRENVSWYQTVAYCKWLADRLGYEIRLPTEAEWEKAACGENGLIYPYGNEYDATKSNTYETGINQTSAVGIFPDGASPFGVMDMSGNVWEWCLNKRRTPEQTEVDSSGDARVLRGGSWHYDQDFARAAYRFNSHPVPRNLNFGFRVVCRPPSP